MSSHAEKVLLTDLFCNYFLFYNFNYTKKSWPPQSYATCKAIPKHCRGNAAAWNKNIIGFRAGSASLLDMLKSDVATSPEDIVMLQVWRGLASVKMCGREEGFVGRGKIFLKICYKKKY